MNNFLMLSASFATGAFLGLVFFWGLWATVIQLSQKHHPALIIISSLLLRFGLILFGFYLIAQHGNWQHILCAVIGFTLMRMLIVHRLRSINPTNEKNKKESIA